MRKPFDEGLAEYTHVDRIARSRVSETLKPEDPKSGHRIVVVIPAFQVAQHIEKVIRTIPPFVSDVVVVDDASTDGTAIAAELADKPRTRIVRRNSNGGVGAATIDGYECAQSLGASVIVKMDGDGQMDGSRIGSLVEPILRGEADYVKGNRFFHSTALRSMPLRRRVGNTGLSFLAKAASGYWEIFDPANGFTAIHPSILNMLDLDRVDRRWFFETSLLIELGLVRAVVRDVNIPARYGTESSTLSEARALVAFPFRLFQALLRRIWLRYFVTDFSAVSVFLLSGTILAMFGLFWGARHWIQSAATGTEASTGTVMLAVLPLLIGWQLLLQAVVLDIQSGPKEPIHPRLTRQPVL